MAHKRIALSDAIMFHRPFQKTALLATFLLLLCGAGGLRAQNYEYVKKSRFLQMYLGVDLVNYNDQIKLNYQSSGSGAESMHVQPSGNTRLVFGGLGMKGRTDLYLAIPTTSTTTEDGITVTYNNGIEMGFRLYVLKVKPNTISPFLGTSLHIRTFKQASSSAAADTGPEHTSLGTSMSFGFLLPTPYGMVELGTQKTSSSKVSYPYYRSGSTVGVADTQLPSSFTWFGYRYLFDTANPDKSSGRSTSGFTLGLGINQTISLKTSPYTYSSRKYLAKRPGTGLYSEANLGYYFGSWDSFFQMSSRTVPYVQKGYGYELKINRSISGLEAATFIAKLGSFHPFLGVGYNQESIAITESDSGSSAASSSTSTVSRSLLGGFDLRVDNKGMFVMRSMFRYTPNVRPAVSSGGILKLDGLEISYFQLVMHFR